MPSAHPPVPSRILGELLASHPEAPSLLAEASHRQALAEHSAAMAGQAFGATQAARVCYEELRHRLDPRGRRPVHFGAGLVLLAVITAALALLNSVELVTALSETAVIPAALAATAVWLTGAWLAALASRDGRRALVAAIIAGGAALSVVLAALHGLATLSGWPPARAAIGGGVVSAGLIAVLAAGAAVLITRMEPASVCLTRRRWRRARSTHEAAARLQRGDAETASVVKQSWLGLVRTHVSAVASGDSEQLVRDTLALASALQEASRQRLDPP